LAICVPVMALYRYCFRKTGSIIASLSYRIGTVIAIISYFSGNIGIIIAS
jgi:hypothetical protein